MNNIQLVNFVKNGGNMLIAVTPDASDTMHALASEFDIELDTEKVLDQTQSVNEDADLIATLNVVAPSSIIDKKQIEAPILFSGTGLTVGQNPLSTAILNKESSTVSLVGALQARNSARVTFVGSLDIFSDKLISSPVDIKSGQS